MKFSFVLGNLGNTRDRFMTGGYKDDQSLESMMGQASSIVDVKGVELIGNWDITSGNVRHVGTLLDRHRLKLVSIIPDHFASKIWARGAFTARDPGVRRQAVACAKEMIDALIELHGEVLNLWPGQDGYDYPLQADFAEASSQLCDGIREIALYRPDIRISLEFKPREPRGFSYLARSSDALLLALKTGLPNVGVTLDTGHAFIGGENIAEAFVRLSMANRLYHLHFNDNNGSWDDDMIVGSIHTVQYVELLYWLLKTRYEGWLSLDQYPYREDSKEALSQSIEWIKSLVGKIEQYGIERISQLVKIGEATTIVRELRTMLLGSTDRTVTQ